MQTLLDVHLAKSIIDKTEYTKPKRSRIFRKSRKSDVMTMMRQHSQKTTKLTYVRPMGSKLQERRNSRAIQSERYAIVSG